jgi:biotin carboxyl carrier protein
MAANVWKISVREGDAVDVGDTVVILESMKMEIPVAAEISGRIRQLHVREGQVVREGDLLATLEEPPPAGA